MCLMLKCILKLLLNMLCNNLAWNIYQISLVGDPGFHLMVLDLMLPGEDGLSICRRLRSQSNPMPIIMVTAKGEEVDRIVGLEIGADDYIPKPFNPRELLARIRAVLRRQANELPGAPSQEEAVIAFGKFKLNLGTHAADQR